jgi:hypothetical protein
VIKDYKLFMVVGILVFIDVATLTTWQIVDPFYRQTSLGTPEVSLKVICSTLAVKLRNLIFVLGALPGFDKVAPSGMFERGH